MNGMLTHDFGVPKNATQILIYDKSGNLYQVEKNLDNIDLTLNRIHKAIQKLEREKNTLPTPPLDRIPQVPQRLERGCNDPTGLNKKNTTGFRYFDTQSICFPKKPTTKAARVQELVA
ncbi:hypothetical protein A946_06870 [Methylacidiphilum kamchatkense Kam1]|uniref:Uncharacterized protein n=2 Tax=Methylacidiphilum kamchatkense TaxID=431057 RepID=A0ABR4ZYN6_9BACT|nr:hypothetical protein A946_06870 [Methylacidiphilum kamchatkense Kam1]